MVLLKLTIYLLLATLTLTTNLQLHDGNIIVFNTSMARSTVSLSLSSKGKVNSSFFVQSELFSPLLNKYELVHGAEKIVTNPPMDEQKIAFNDYDGAEYWFAIKHPIKNAEAKDVNFIGLRLTDNDKIIDYILPAFPQPLSFLPINSMYRCGNVLLSVTTSQSGVDVALFSNRSSGLVWNEGDQKWDWGWRKQAGQFDIGRFTRKDKSKKVKIQLSSGQFCQFDASNLGKPKGQGVAKNGYLTFDKVLGNAVQLQKREEQKQL